MKRFAGLSLLFLVLLFPALALAESPGSTTLPESVSTAARIIVLAGMVAAIVQGIKRAFPAIAGVWAVVLNILSSVAATYAAAPEAKVLSIGFLLSALATVVTAGGLHAFLTGGNQKDTISTG